MQWAGITRPLSRVPRLRGRAGTFDFGAPS